MRISDFGLRIGGLALLAAAGAAGAAMQVDLRSRVQDSRRGGEWREVRIPAELNPATTAIVICDMWDRHWCRGASERVEELVRKAAPLLAVARQRGVLIIHAPSDTMAFYKDAPQRLAILQIAPVEPPAAKVLPDPPLPIDDSDGGCDTPGDRSYRAWSRQHPGILIAANDLVSDNGREIYSALRQRGIRKLLVMGVHTNMCILNRSFAIKQMTRWGVECILIRDLTDAMYDPLDRPFVSHEKGTALVVEHIEKHWAPTVLSTDLLRVFAK